jgi:hypothetical protein
VKLSRFLIPFLLASAAAPAMAYEEDTHFQITYIICRVAGFNAADSLTVAAADQGVDDSPNTEANNGAIPKTTGEWMWHALDHDGKMGPKGIIARKDAMFEAAERAPGHPLVLLGVFFHYQQDTWAHRHHDDGDVHSYDRYTTYNTPFGHAKAGHQPDRPPFDPITAILDMEDGLRYAKRYLVEVMHKQPRKFVADYQPAGGTVARKWSRDGKYFHQLNQDGPVGSARRFFTDIIRLQIESYGKTTDPMYTLHDTADKVDLGKTAANFQKCCDFYYPQIGVHINIPNRGDKESKGFMHLTTEGLVKMGMTDRQ